jgi:tetratricopeptide (TPR) repeat protein
MTQTLRRIGILAAAALLTTALGMNPLYAIGTDEPPPPSDNGGKTHVDQKKSGGTHKKKSTKKPSKKQKESDQRFLKDYRAARAMILAKHYKEGIVAMHALGHDAHPDVANYIGYAYRKMGDYADSKIWYEKALAADPKHVRTWSYYGMWQVEQGHPDQAKVYLAKIKTICGNTSCKAYRELKEVIEGEASY